MTKVTEALFHPETSAFVTEREVINLVSKMHQLYHFKLQQQRHETLGERTFGQLGVHARDINGDGGNHVLKLGLGQSAISTSAQAEGADGLG